MIQCCGDGGAAPTTILDLSAGNLLHTGDPVGFTSAVLLTVERLVASEVIREATTDTQGEIGAIYEVSGLDLDQSHLEWLSI